MSGLKVRVERRWRAAEGIVALELVSADSAVNLPPYEAGAHIDVNLPNGLVRQYSLCGHPEQIQGPDARYRIAVLHELNGRGGSKHLHEAVEEGHTLSIGLPRNAFRLEPHDGRSVLLAGGVGITPLIAMAYRLAAQEADFQLHLFVRTRDRAPFLAELTSAPLARHVFLHVDDEMPQGQASALDLVLAEVVPGDHAYACGPAGFLSRSREVWRARGLREQDFHYESFVPVVPAGEAGTFEVEVTSTGNVVVVQADETVAAALARCGVHVPLSCEQGICGTCLTGVTAGIPDHRDQYLGDEEHARNDCFTPCCSRSHTPRLVLNL